MTSSLVCDQATIFSTAMTWQQKCQLLSNVCGEDQETFNFFKLYMCDFNGNNILWALFIILVIIVLFKFICSTIDEYVSPGIVYLSEKLQLSEALAGVTLLAFANGAGDVVTAIVASNSKDGISYNVGALYGAGFFVLTLVVAFTILLSPVKIVVSKSVIFRDIGFYIIATLLTLFMAYRGQISESSSLFMLFLYLVYVLVVVVQDRYDPQEEQKQDTQQAQSMEQVEPQVELKEKDIEQDDDDEDEERKKLLHNFLRDKNLSIPSKLHHKYLQYEMMLKKEQLREETEGVFGKIIDFIDTPFYYIRLLTIPPSNSDEYEHKYTKYWAFFGILFLGVYMGAHHIMHYVLLLAISLILYYIFSLHKNQNEIPSYFFILVLVSVYIGILWTKICSGLLVDLLTQIGRIANISTTYLGLTVIAVGNALPDGLTTISIAKNGQAIMGLTGGIAGQLFGFLIGFGIAMFKMTSKAGGSLAFDLFNPEKLHENLLDLIVVLIALTTLLFIFFYSIFNNYHFDKKMAYILIIFYLGMIAITTTVVVIQS